MRLRWWGAAIDDLGRLHRFLRPKNRQAADRLLRDLRLGALKLVDLPRKRERIDLPGPREIRRLLVDDYELRYELIGDEIRILRVWHTRESR